jgi:hypothetical protein
VESKTEQSIRLSEKTARILNEINRVLREAGSICVMEPVPVWDYSGATQSPLRVRFELPHDVFADDTAYHDGHAVINLRDAFVKMVTAIAQNAGMVPHCNNTGTIYWFYPAEVKP